MPKILIINSSLDKNYLLTQTLKELALKNFTFCLWSSSRPLYQRFKEKSWPAKFIFLGPALNSYGNVIFFLIILPFVQLIFLFSLFKLKLKHQVDAVICLNLNEKIIASLPAKLVGLKIIWLESPDLNYRQINKILFALYKIYSKMCRLIVFNSYARLQLINCGLRDSNIILLAPGTKLAPYQENIFNKLASSGQEKFHRKYFTVGAITALNQKQKIETIFQAIKTCLSVIPNIQLIIIGEGEERKNLLWLAKKMGIEDLVWLVGEQEHLTKWLDSFDIFLVSSENLGLDDYGNILEAMAAELPVLAPRNVGLEDLIVENKTGSLIETDNNEMLARQIIKLNQDKRLRLQLGKNGCQRVNKLFPLDKMAAGLEHILKN